MTFLPGAQLELGDYIQELVKARLLMFTIEVIPEVADVQARVLDVSLNMDTNVLEIVLAPPPGWEVRITRDPPSTIGPQVSDPTDRG